MSNKPTDAELDAIDMAAQAIANQNPIGTPFAWRKAYLAAFASAVLAKWGTPQPADCTRSHPHEDMSGYCLLRTEIARLANENARLKASQPVVREPLGNKELQAISLEYSDSEDECTGFRDGWRFAEKHYDIPQRGGA